MNFQNMLPYQFDQIDEGWRSLDKDGNYLKAAQLILDYIRQNKSKIASNSSVATLYFHAGQEYAMVGSKYYPDAIECFENSYKDNEAWDLYVKGTIAFLRGNLKLLEASINEGAANQEILLRLLKAIKKDDYSYAKNY